MFRSDGVCKSGNTSAKRGNNNEAEMLLESQGRRLFPLCFDLIKVKRLLVALRALSVFLVVLQVRKVMTPRQETTPIVSRIYLPLST